MSNILKLHKAIVVILLHKINRIVSTQEIADEMNSRGLYQRKDGGKLPDYQVMQRAKLSNG